MAQHKRYEARARLAISDEELELGVRSIAVPVLSSSGTTIAAVSVSVGSTRMSRAQVEEKLLPELLTAARSLSGRV